MSSQHQTQNSMGKNIRKFAKAETEFSFTFVCNGRVVALKREDDERKIYFSSYRFNKSAKEQTQ